MFVLNSFSTFVDTVNTLCSQQKAEETTDLLAQKALVAEEEARLLLKKAAELERETKQLKMTCMAVRDDSQTMRFFYLCHVTSCSHCIVRWRCRPLFLLSVYLTLNESNVTKVCCLSFFIRLERLQNCFICQQFKQKEDIALL